MANHLVEKIENALADARVRLAGAADAAVVEALRVELLGRNGLLPALSREMGTLPAEERKATGAAFNSGRTELQALMEQALERLAGAADQSDVPDLTLPGRRIPTGRRHPLSIIIDDCVKVFSRIGFLVAEGPEIETVWRCFDALNAPADHPSRDPSDTFYFEDGRIMRTQTSTVQIKVMETQKPPIRILAPGSCFRRDTPDATHSMNFHQIEGLMVDEHVSLADLKSVLALFARETFGEKVTIRMRPHFFPFTEPSVEYDFSCIMCGGKGCRVCKNSGFIEIGGAGMVDPNVFRNVGIDPEKYTGYAFGLGIERLAMLRYRIGDLRFFCENDVRFLEQFTR